MNQEPEQRYPYLPGFQVGSETSKEAAEAIEGRVPTIRDMVWAVLIDRSMTPDEVASALNLSILTVRPRVTELRRMGLIRDTGQRRSNESGHKAAVMTGR